MAPKKPKITVKYFGSFGLQTIENDGFEESPNFSAPYSSTSFNLRVTKEGQLSLHLATCCQEKLHIDKFDVEFRNRFDPTTYSLSLSGVTSLDGDYLVACSLGDVYSSLNNWNIVCTVTYKEPRAKVVDHKKKLTDQLVALRWDTNLSDVTLVTVDDGEEHSANKLILSLRSPVFAAMFKHQGVVENVLNRVEIEGVSGDAMMTFLDYVYSGDISTVHWCAAEVFELANKYDIPPLAQACIELFTVGDAAQLYYLTDLHQQINYKKMVMRFIGKNMRAVRKTNGWNVFIKPNATLLDQLMDYL